jgi:hypothetical protein
MTPSLENFTGVSRNLDVNYAMVKRALCVAAGLLGALCPVVAQQGHHSSTREKLHSSSASNAPLSLPLYRPKISGSMDNSLLLHNGSVPLWLDGPQMSAGDFPGYSFASQWVQMGFTAPDFLPPALASAVPPAAQAPTVRRPHASDSKDPGTDGKDSPDEMLSPSSNLIYSGGEIGVLYGRWSGKGGGDMWETYITGTVGNDKFQITAGASYDEWNANGRSVRFRSFSAPR